MFDLGRLVRTSWATPYRLPLGTSSGLTAEAVQLRRSAMEEYQLFVEQT